MSNKEQIKSGKQEVEGQIFDDVSEDLFRTLAENYDKEFNKSELVEKSGRSRMVLYNGDPSRWDIFEKYDIVEKIDSQKYKLNIESPVTHLIAAVLYMEDEDGEAEASFPWESEKKRTRIFEWIRKNI